MRREGKIFISGCLLVLFLCYQVGIIAFTHVHYVNGVMVVHSHPFGNDTHEHSAAQLLLIGQLSHVEMTAADLAPALTADCPLLYVIEPIRRVGWRMGVRLPSSLLRAPPSMR